MARRRARTQTERKQILDLVMRPLNQLRDELTGKKYADYPEPPKRDVETLERVVERLAEAGFRVSVSNYGNCGPDVSVKADSEHPVRKEREEQTRAQVDEVWDRIHDIQRAVLYSDNYDAEALDAQAKTQAAELRKKFGL